MRIAICEISIILSHFLFLSNKKSAKTGFGYDDIATKIAPRWGARSKYEYC